MLLYITVGTNDVARAGKFYDAALAPLGMNRDFGNDIEIAYSDSETTTPGRKRFFWVVSPYMKAPATWGNGSMVAFAAANRQAVRDFHAAALANGGTDEGEPGLRPYHESFYACYVRDPDGNKLSAVCEVVE